MRYKPCFCGRRESPLQRHRGVLGIGERIPSVQWENTACRAPKICKAELGVELYLLGQQFFPKYGSSQRQYPTHSVHSPLPSQQSPLG